MIIEPHFPGERTAIAEYMLEWSFPSTAAHVDHCAIDMRRGMVDPHFAILYMLEQERTRVDAFRAR